MEGVSARSEGPATQKRPQMIAQQQKEIPRAKDREKGIIEESVQLIYDVCDDVNPNRVLTRALLPLNLFCALKTPNWMRRAIACH